MAIDGFAIMTRCRKHAENARREDPAQYTSHVQKSGSMGCCGSACF